MEKKPIKIEIKLDYGYDESVLNRAFESIKETLKKGTDFKTCSSGGFHFNTAEGVLDLTEGGIGWTQQKQNSDSFSYWIRAEEARGGNMINFIKQEWPAIIASVLFGALATWALGIVINHWEYIRGTF